MYALQEVGEYDVDLEISIKMMDGDRIVFMSTKDCKFRLIVHEAPYFGIDLGTVSFQKFIL